MAKHKKKKRNKDSKPPALVFPRKCEAQNYEDNCWFKDAICIHCGFNPLKV